MNITKIQNNDFSTIDALASKRGIEDKSVLEQVRQIVNAVREKGDQALFQYTAHLDNVPMTQTLEVTHEEWEMAHETIPDHVEESNHTAGDAPEHHLQNFRNRRSHAGTATTWHASSTSVSIPSDYSTQSYSAATGASTCSVRRIVNGLMIDWKSFPERSIIDQRRFLHDNTVNF